MIIDKTIANINKIKHILRAILGVALIYIFLYEIDSVRGTINNLILYAESYDLLLGFSAIEIKQFYFNTRKYAIYYIVFYILILFINKAIYFIHDKCITPQTNELDTFEDSLNKYLNDENCEKCYLVTGNWGTGKTYSVSKYFVKYFKFTNRKVYRISCFGLESREQVLNEIKEQVELNDETLLNLVQYIPFIGPTIYGLLKKSFSLQSIPKRSIFIFDDFERITSRGIIENGSSNFYRKDPFINNNSTITEFKKIEKEFTKIEAGFNILMKNEASNIIFNHTQKYNIVTGLINEIIETYKMKVIIICNIDIMGYDYVDKIFRGKLDCITYNRIINATTIKSIIRDSLNNQIYSDKSLKKIASDFFEKIGDDFELLWITCGKNNLRQAKSIIQAFLETIEIIFNDNKNINNDYLTSLLYSIFVIRLSFDENKLQNFDNFRTGGLLSFYLKLYQKESIATVLSKSKYIENIKWVGISNAGFWILNMSKPNNINVEFDLYNKYKYIKIENEILNNFKIDFEKCDLLLEHVFYQVKEKRREMVLKKDDIFIKEMSNSLKKITHSLLANDGGFTSQDKVQAMLGQVYIVSQGLINDELFNVIFDSLYSETNVDFISGDFYLCERYNEYVKKSKSSQPI